MANLDGGLQPVFHLHDALPLHDDQPTDFAVYRVPGEAPPPSSDEPRRGLRGLLSRRR
jgi:hypothetical protein